MITLRALLCACLACAVFALTPLSDEDLQLVCFLKKRLGCSATLGWRSLMLNSTVGLRYTLNSAATKSCAVVSSSGALLKHANGPEIDSHDIVFRFNAAPTLGYEQFVGNKTDVRLGWDFQEFAHDQSVANGLDLWYLSRPGSAMMSHLYPTNLGVKGEHGSLTTGFLGMMLAFFSCASVDSYEMTPSTVAATSLYHYYDKNLQVPADFNDYHMSYKAEHDLWARLSTTSMEEVRRTGKTHTVGFSQVQCPGDMPEQGSLEPAPPPSQPCATQQWNFSFTVDGLDEDTLALPSECLTDMVRIKVGDQIQQVVPHTQLKCVEVQLLVPTLGVSTLYPMNVSGSVATDASREAVLAALVEANFTHEVCNQIQLQVKGCAVKDVLVGQALGGRAGIVGRSEEQGRYFQALGPAQPVLWELLVASVIVIFVGMALAKCKGQSHLEDAEGAE